MNSEFIRITLSLLEGFGMTLKIFALTLVFSLPLGLIISFGSMSRFRPLKWLIRVFVWIIRGTPLMLQLIAIFYMPGFIGKWASSIGGGGTLITALSGLTVPDRFTAVMVAFIINYACYFSEIYRGGIESMPRGQYEAGAVLGMTKMQVFFKIILFQVIKKIVPPMGNEIIWSAQKFAKMEGLVWPLFYTGAYYLIFCGVLTLLFGYIEKKLDYYKG